MATQTTVFKAADEEQRIVWAEVYAPNRPDSDGEYMDADGIRKMAYEFMKTMKLDQIDSQHNNELVPGACVVESFIARKDDPDFLEGAWVVGVYIHDDDMWEKVKKGEINGFSMEAMVSKEVKEVTLEVPPIISGRTMKAEGDGEVEDHTHTFHVAYDESGRFLGGKTDSNHGHYHLIRRGTVTEDAEGHRHKFDHVEDVLISE